MRQYMSGIAGNQALRQMLCSDIIANKLSHAFILEGGKGTGKHTVAINVCAALACVNKHKKEYDVPCGECPECKKIFGAKSPDIITVGCEGKATLGIDTVRFLREDVHTVPNDLDFKVYVIEDADKMTAQAQNALLLTLEEPPSFVRFILLCENSNLLLETIRSRAPVLRTEPVPDKELDDFICKTDRRAAQMKLSFPKEYAELIVAAKHGIGRALDYLDPKSFAPIKDVRRLTRDFLSEATDNPDPKNILSLISRFPGKRDALTGQLICLSEAIRDLMLLKKSDNAPLCFFSDRNFAIEICDKSSSAFLYRLGEATMTAIDSISKNANVRVTLIKLACDAELI